MKRMRVESFHPSPSLNRPPGEKYFQHVAVILLEASFGRRHSSGNFERLGDQRRKAFHQHPRHECDKHEVYVCVERANPRTKGFVVEPGRLLKILEEIAQDLRRTAQNLIMLLYASLDEPVQVLRRKRGEFLHQRVHHRIANGRVPDIVVGLRLIIETGLRIPFSVCQRWLCYCSPPSQLAQRIHEKALKNRVSKRLYYYRYDKYCEKMQKNQQVGRYIKLYIRIHSPPLAL